jgi:tRNA-intron endonuclease, archaea type
MVKKELIKARLVEDKVLCEDCDEARELYNTSRFGAIKRKKLELSLIEAFYLMEKEKIVVLDGRNKPMSSESYMKKARKREPNFWIRYSVFSDFRDRGYIIKTALKFGADFRVYDRGVKPGEDHAKWVVFPVSEGNTLTWHEFSAKNRVAHSTKKRLLLGIVDAEGDVVYYETRWIRP